ncbi:MAG: polysaccharide deacetylase family protein [Sphingobium sp.]
MTASPAPRCDLCALPDDRDFIALGAAFGTRFLLTVDTEEEFDWNIPFDRESRSVTISEAMRRGQGYFRATGVRPLYLADYPMIDDPVTGPMLAQWVAAGEADIGAHCHPWVNPPHEEAVSIRNSFAGNLPEALERAKLTVLRDRITEVTGRPPLAFRAGRYGAGPNTGAILCDLGFRVDSSVRSRFSYAGEQGPDFSGMPVRPYRVGGLVELPLSTAWCGLLRGAGDSLQRLIDGGGIAAGAMARSGLLQRIPLTPEGVSPAEAKRAIDRLLGDGLRLLVFSFHSPTLAPGHTPYVRNDDDLNSFWRWWDDVLAHLALRGVAPASLDEILSSLPA